MRKLPLGIQNFKEIREEDYLYIDKTKEAYELITNFKYVFLSRPRRFGKSLFLDTLRHIFEGNKSLFRGLYICDKWEFEKFPVIKISWAGSSFASYELVIEKAREELRKNEEKFEVKCDKDLSPFGCFGELIRKIYKKYNKRVVILVDEYDKPILNVIDNLELAAKNREFIKAFYEVIKDNDEYIKFCFLTGVSKFSKASVFSGLNMLTDISLDERYGNICGYTQKDIEVEFKEYLKGIDLDKFRAFYNGYNFLKDAIYNPFDTLQFIVQNFKFRNYWFESGTPAFLIKLIEKKHYFLPKLSNLVVGEEILSSFDVENLNIEILLYQSGYLTIEKIIETPFGASYKLKLPNIEVKQALNDYIIDFLLKQESKRVYFKTELYYALLKADLEKFEKILKSLFSSIPYNNLTYIKNYEGFYASVIFVYLQSLGFDVIGEDVTNVGRIDLSVKLIDKIYIIEFKINDEEPLKQIKEKRYYEKYLGKFNEIYLVGIVFDKKSKNIKKFEWEKLV